MAYYNGLLKRKSEAHKQRMVIISNNHDETSEFHLE